jgi:hypothetical protein
MINTLGVAQFRLGDYEAALATLTRADAINSRFTAAIYAAPSTQARPTHAGNPVDVAFIAMTLHHLGRTTEARAAMDRMHALMSQDSFGRDANWAVAAEEAEHVVPR